MSKEKKVIDVTEMTLEELVSARDTVASEIEAYLADRQELFAKDYSNEGEISVPVELFFKMTNHISNTSMQFGILVASTEEFLTKMRRAVVATDLTSQKVKQEVLQEIENNILVGALKEKVKIEE